MAKFTAFVSADTVGSPTETIPIPLDGYPIGPSGSLIEYATHYQIFEFSGDNLVYFTERPTIFDPVTDRIHSIWEADAGDVYPGVNHSLLILDPSTKTEEVQQFYFAFDDKIRGSDFDDKLCGWAGKDKMWGFEGRDEFHYGKGMGKDTICDYEKKKDEIVLDDSVATKFKKLKKVKYNEKKDFAQINAGNGDKLKVYGIDTEKELKKALTFADFTDFA